MFGGKVLIWIHGHEAINWYRRLYDYSFLDIIKHLPGLLFLLIKRKYSWNRINKLSRSNNRITFIFVSKWMKKVTEIDNFVKFKNYKIIPNGIDTTRFKFVQKTELDRLNIISIRPFNSKKYANDITISTILELSKRSFFNNLKFTIIGKGAF
jgi:glycosyltransferase involved in cell wall biosynthesis